MIAMGSNDRETSFLALPMSDPSQLAAQSPEKIGEGARPHEEGDFSRLPPYTRSLLRIQVPLRVTLASTRLPLASIVELAPGSIIQFAKACDDPLSLSVGEHEIAVGDAIKVGDKFGLRVTSMVLPEEKFRALTSGRKP